MLGRIIFVGHMGTEVYKHYGFFISVGIRLYVSERKGKAFSVCKNHRKLIFSQVCLSCAKTFVAFQKLEFRFKRQRRQISVFVFAKHFTVFVTVHRMLREGCGAFRHRYFAHYKLVI